jgi:hypothetical protein
VAAPAVAVAGALAAAPHRRSLTASAPKVTGAARAQLAYPAAAADIYVTDFERAGVPAAGTREAAATAVAAACGI